MSNGILLDTNIVADYFNKKASIRARFEEFIGQDIPIYTSVITIGELCYGAYKSQRTEQNLEQIYQFADICTVLDCTFRTGVLFGQLQHSLRLKGRPIPENDIWIASIAVQYGLQLATRDAHFAEIDILIRLDW